MEPEAIETRLRLAGCYLAAFEVLRHTVEDDLVGFFADRHSEDGPLPSDEYRREVLSLHKSPPKAVVLWYCKMGVLDSRDADRLQVILEHRNEVAHDLVDCMLDPGRDVRRDLISEMIEYTDRIGKFWMETWRDAGLGPPAGAEYLAATFLRHLLSCT